MNTLGTVLGWAFGLILLLFVIFNLMSGHWLPAVPLILLLLLVFPLTRQAIRGVVSLPEWAYAILMVVLFVGYVVILFWSVMITEDVFKTPQVKAEMMAFYDEKMEQWPVPYETQMVETSYGAVYVVISGPEDAPPALLLHASAMSAWSWLYNVEALSQDYRTYAIDTLGEANRSVLNDTAVYPANGEELADLYAEIADGLDIDRAVVVGASFGGFIGTSYALKYPERVEKLALLGPMGMTPATGETALRIMGAQFFPAKPVQNSTVRWALGEDSYVLTESADWFGNVMTGVLPRVVRPTTFAAETLQTLDVPVLLVIGTRDALTGDPEKVRELAQNVPDIEIHVLDSGHLIGIEKADEVNELLPDFFRR